MNSEYALIKLLLNDPHQILHLQRKGFRKKYFKNQEYGNVYKLIHDTYQSFSSTPTSEQLKEFGIQVDKEPVPHTIQHCVDQIEKEYKKQVLKEVLVAAGQSLVKEGPDSAIKLLNQSNNYLIDLNKSERSKDINELNEEFLESYKRRAEFRGQITGVPTGFDEFDRHTNGLQNQWLITIAGRNASFKTWVLLYWALNAWRKGNVAIFSCEMSNNELINRIHCLGANVPPTKLRDCLMDDIEEARLMQHIEKSQKSPWGHLILNDNPISIADVDSEIKKINEQTPLDIVFIDSAYRMRSDGDNEVTKQASIARDAKNLAKKYNIPVVCTVQLNRDFARANATDKTKDKTTSGGYFIHGTDAWNQDSDIILSINRPENYTVHNYSDFILDKFRHGQQGLNYILEINLALPLITQVSADEARTRIGISAPIQTTRANDSLALSQNIISEYRTRMRQNHGENT
jgi:replicative DNA helicase